MDAVQNTTLRLFLPECVDPALIAKLIPFPDAIREQRAAWDLCVLYFNNRRRYPWQCYMNIEPSDFGEHNPLGGDDEIVRYAYALAHREFHRPLESANALSAQGFKGDPASIFGR